MQSVSTILLTGAAGNLGAAVAHVLAARGTRLVLVDRTQEGLAAVAARLPEGTEVLVALIDGDDLDDAERAALHAAIAESDAELESGHGLPESELWARLRSGTWRSS